MLEISNLINELQILEIDCDIYLFGSYLKSSKWADLDFLVVYRNYEDVKKLREVFSRHFQHTPLDLNFMTQEEEGYFNFISQTNAQQIFPKISRNIKT